jgi:antitoxin component HigA of HigAB toxin-antitoxin module
VTYFSSSITYVITRKRLNKKEYNKAVRLLDSVIDTLGEDENHPRASLMEIIRLLIEKYEDDHVPEITEAWIRKVPEDKNFRDF